MMASSPFLGIEDHVGGFSVRDITLLGVSDGKFAQGANGLGGHNF